MVEKKYFIETPHHFQNAFAAPATLLKNSNEKTHLNEFCLRGNFLSNVLPNNVLSVLMLFDTNHTNENLAKSSLCRYSNGAYAPVKLFCPQHLSGSPGDITFLGAALVFITLFLPCPVLINHFTPLILEWSALFSLHFPVPRPFYHTNYSSNPWPARGDGGRTI